MFSKLPTETVRHILEYDGRFKWRAGRFVPQIAPDDPRYAVVRRYVDFVLSDRTFTRIPAGFYGEIHGVETWYVTVYIKHREIEDLRIVMVMSVTENKIYKPFVFMRKGAPTKTYAYMEYENMMYSHTEEGFTALV